MPKGIPYRLQWSSSTQEYSVFHDGRPITPKIDPASQHWFAWLETISSFSFQSRSGGGCTVRKETVQRGGTYWYAYRRKEQRMVNRYLARSADLTLARLETVTAALNNPEATNGIQQVLEVLPGAVLEIIPRSSRPALFAFGLWAQARIEWAQSRPEAATYFLELVRKQPEIMGELSPGKERPPVNVSMLAARLALICDQIEEAIRWESTCGIRFKEFLYGRDYYERFPVTRNKKRSPYVLRATALDGTTLLCRGTECLGFNNL